MLGVTLATSNLVCCIAGSKTNRRTQPELSCTWRLYLRRKIIKVVKSWHLSPFRVGTRCDHCCQSATSCSERSVYRLKSRNEHQHGKQYLFLLHMLSCYLVLASDCVEFLLTCCNVVVPREVSQRCSWDMKYFRWKLEPFQYYHPNSELLGIRPNVRSIPKPVTSSCHFIVHRHYSVLGRDVLFQMGSYVR